MNQFEAYLLIVLFSETRNSVIKLEKGLDHKGTEIADENAPLNLEKVNQYLRIKKNRSVSIAIKQLRQQHLWAREASKQKGNLHTYNVIIPPRLPSVFLPRSAYWIFPDPFRVFISLKKLLKSKTKGMGTFSEKLKALGIHI